MKCQNSEMGEYIWGVENAAEYQGHIAGYFVLYLLGGD